MKGLTTDAFFSGRIKIKQSRSGYRFSIDAVLLASHAKLRPKDTVVDLGTGCGIIPIILAFQNPTVVLYGLEIQKNLVDIAALNVKENHLEDQIQIILGDMKTFDPEMIPKPVDLVISNPPYRSVRSGRLNPNHQRARAKHEITVTLAEVVQTARRMLRAYGRFIMIYLAERITDVLNQLRSNTLEPKFLRTIHSRINTEAKLILVEGIKGARPGLKIAPPLIIYQEDGSYTEEIQKMFEYCSYKN